MSAAEKELRIRIAGRVDNSLTAATAAAQQQVGGLGSKLATLGKAAVAGIGGLAVGAAISDTVNTYKDFDQALAQTAATAGASGADYQKLQDAAMAAGRGTTKTATEAAQALGYLSLAGYSVEESTEALTPILKLSEATQMDLAQCSDLVTDSMSAAGVAIGDMPGYLDVLCKANNKSNQTAGQLMEAMIAVGGTMKGLNVPIEETSTALGVLANRGIKGAEGGTALNSIMANLTTGAGQAGEMMEKLGVSAFDSNGKFIGVQATLMRLNDATKDLTEEQRNAAFAAIGGKEQVKALNALMDGLNHTTADGTTEWNSLHEALLNSGGSLEEMNAQVTNTLSGAMARFGSALDDIKIRAGLAFGPALATAINYVSNNLMPMLSAAMDNLGPILSAIGNELQYVGGIIADNWSTFGPIITGIGIAFGTWKLAGIIADLAMTVTETLALKAAEIEYAVAAKAKNLALFLSSSAYRKNVIAATASAFATKAHAIADNAYVIATSLATAATTAFGVALQVATGPIGRIIFLLAGLVAAGIWVYKNWDTIKEKASELWAWLGDAFSSGVDMLSSIWTSITDNVSGAFTWLVDGAKSLGTAFVNALASIGGKIKGFGSSLLDSFLNNTVIGQQIQAKILPKIAKLVSVIGERFSAIKDGIVSAFNSTTGAISGWIAAVAGKFQTIKAAVIQGFADAVSAVGSWLGSVKEAIASTITSICTQVVAFFAPLVTAVQNVLTVIGEIWTAAMAALSSGVDMVASFLTNVGNAIIYAFTLYYQIFATGFAVVYDALAAFCGSLIDSITACLSSMIDALSSFIDFLINVFTGNWAAAWENVVSIFGSIFAGIEALAAAPINAVIALINSLISKLNSVSFDVPDWVPGLGGKHFGFSVPSIPALASGGIATSPTLAMIGEGSESEAVLPLSKLQGMLDGVKAAKSLPLDSLSNIVNSRNGGGNAIVAASPENITFSPQISIQGNATKEDVLQATAEAFEQFKNFMARYEREHKRFAFSQ